LRAFVTVADSGGFTRAAVRLNLSQPALSRQIAGLEIELEVRLFDRIGRRIQLTSEGEDLLQWSRRLVSDADALGDRARALKGGQTGILRVGATPQNLENLLADFLGHYRRRHPAVEVHLVEDGAVRLRQRLERGDVQIAILQAGEERFHGRLLFPMSLLAVPPPGHRLGRRVACEVADLADEPLLVLRREFRSREWLEAACERAHIRPRLLLESGVPHTLLALARAGCGIAIIPSNVVPGAGVRAVPLLQQGAAIGRWATIAWDPQRFLAPYAKRFVDELVVYSRRAFPGRHLTRRAPALPPPPKAMSAQRDVRPLPSATDPRQP
jgi:DNA-binding transcriptional LysR family regulator